MGNSEIEERSPGFLGRVTPSFCIQTMCGFGLLIQKLSKI